MTKKLTIRQWRILKGYSQKEFAKMIGISHSAYQTKESGNRDWSGTELIKISQILNASLETEIDFSK